MKVSEQKFLIILILGNVHNAIPASRQCAYKY